MLLAGVVAKPLAQNKGQEVMIAPSFALCPCSTHGTPCHPFPNTFASSSEPHRGEPSVTDTSYTLWMALAMVPASPGAVVSQPWQDSKIWVLVLPFLCLLFLGKRLTLWTMLSPIFMPPCAELAIEGHLIFISIDSLGSVSCSPFSLTHSSGRSVAALVLQEPNRALSAYCE